MERKIILFTITFFIIIFITSPSPIRALPWGVEYTDQSVAAGSWLFQEVNVTAGDTLSGYIETDADTMGLDFFICDAYNYGEWSAGNSATVYSQKTNMHTMWFSLDIPYTDTWYLVYSNRDGSSTVSFDLGLDLNDDNAPYYSTTDYSETVYAEVLEPDQYYALHNTFQPGTVISGHFSTFFTTDGLEFFICDESDYNTWISGGSITKYDHKDNYHGAYIDSFTIPYAGEWYLVFSTEGQEDTITFSCGINVDTSGGATTNTNSFSSQGLEAATAIGIASIVGLAVICGLWQMTVRKKEPPSTPVAERMPKEIAAPESSTKELVLGALKSYPRLSMSELSEILNIPIDVVRRATLFLVASGELKGTFDKGTDEFTSVSASAAGRELRKDASAELDLPRCPNCGAPFTKSFVVGDTVECENCGVKFTV